MKISSLIISIYTGSILSRRKTDVYSQYLNDINDKDIKNIEHIKYYTYKITTFDNEEFYVKVVPKIHSKKKFLTEKIKGFYWSVDESNRGIFIDYLKKSLASYYNRYLFLYMGPLYDPNAGYFLALKDNNFGKVGLGSDYSKCIEEDIRRFILFMVSCLDIYRLNRGQRNNDYMCYYSSRTMATREIALAIGLGNIVPESCVMKISIEGKKLLCVGTTGCSGFRVYLNEKIPDNVKRVSPILQRLFCGLELLDIICYDKDHGTRNYLLTYEKDEITGLKIFDNDCPSSFLPVSSVIFRSYDNTSEYVDRNLRMVNRPFIDKEYYSRIVEFEKNGIRRVGKFLSALEVVALKSRTRKLVSVIDKSIKAGKTVLLDKNDWNKNTINVEVSDKYGDTPFTKCFKELKNRSHDNLEWQNI